MVIVGYLKHCGKRRYNRNAGVFSGRVCAIGDVDQDYPSSRPTQCLQLVSLIRDADGWIGRIEM